MGHTGDDNKIRQLCGPITTALDSMDDGVIIISADRLVEYMNPSAAALFSAPPFVGEQPTFIEVVRDYECDTLLRKCMETGSVQSAAVRLQEGKKLLLVSVSPDIELRYYIAIMKDLTERQHLEDIRRDLISNISHEFRTPIASIKLLSETLIDAAADDPVKSREFLHKIAVEADKLTHMTDDLRELAAIEKGGSVLRKGAVNLSELIGHVVRRMEAQARAGGLKLEVHVENGLPNPVIDGSRIESVLMNLVHNAIKFSYPGGKITVGARQGDNDVLVSIGDTGQGIAPEDLPHIFERFYKVDRARAGEGSGLGLSIAKHIIAAHGGKIWAESEAGRGSTFYFTLPLSA